jgi:hypothetical protein
MFASLANEPDPSPKPSRDEIEATDLVHADDGGGIIREVDVEGGVHLLVRPATEGNRSGLGCNIGRGQQCPRWDNRGVISVY